MQRPFTHLILALSLFAVALFGCNPVAPNTPSAHVATINLMEIEDKSSRQPIDNVRWQASLFEYS